MEDSSSAASALKGEYQSEKLEEPKSSSSEDSPVVSIGGGDLSKLRTPYYSYFVDKTIKSGDSHYWARHSSYKAEQSPICDDSSPITPEEEKEMADPQAINELEDQQVKSELEDLYTRFHKCLDLRDKYMELSLQRSRDNPKDSDDWKIYPPHHENKKREVGEDFEFEKCEIPGVHEYNFRLDESGVYKVYKTQEVLPAYKVPSVKDYFMDLDEILNIISDGPAKSYAYRRLRYLESKWNMYSLLKEYQEIADSKKVPHRDFYNVRKVDTHVHLSSCMNSKHLLRFIKAKLKKAPYVCYFI